MFCNGCSHFSLYLLKFYTSMSPHILITLTNGQKLKSRERKDRKKYYQNIIRTFGQSELTTNSVSANKSRATVRADGSCVRSWSHSVSVTQVKSKYVLQWSVLPLTSAFSKSLLSDQVKDCNEAWGGAGVTWHTDTCSDQTWNIISNEYFQKTEKIQTWPVAEL